MALQQRTLNFVLAGAALFCFVACSGCAQETSPPPKADTTVLVPGSVGGSANASKSQDMPPPKALVPPK